MLDSKQILETFKKRKRMPKLYNFQTFADPGCPITLTGPFRDNIRQFLQQCAEVEDYNIDGMPIWCTFLVHKSKGLVIPLYTIEETTKNSFQPYCDQCRCTGNHFPQFLVFLLHFLLDFHLGIFVLDLGLQFLG